MNIDTDGDGTKDVNMMQKLIDHKKTLGVVQSDYSSEFTFGMGYDKKSDKWDGGLFQIGRIRFNDKKGILFNNDSSEGLVERYENGKLIKGDKVNSPTSILGHEMVHFYNYIFDNANWFQRRKQDSDKLGFKNQEEYKTTILSNQINEALNESQRTVYEGIYVPVKNVKSHEIQK
ncbi:M91 family zinc metallopeptidase [Chryseobacterium sp. Alg-005]|uniref:M91 family zinc metallopeptidase n=1 Tax=Chryseobacterium sp. Alg-005 TaxID=3159516 RepID=UPI0036F44019